MLINIGGLQKREKEKESGGRGRWVEGRGGKWYGQLLH